MERDETAVWQKEGVYSLGVSAVVVHPGRAEGAFREKLQTS